MMWRKRDSHVLVVEMQTGAATVKNSMEVSQKIKNITTLKSRNHNSIYPKIQKH